MQAVRNGAVSGGNALGGIQHEEDQIALLKRRLGPLHALALDRILGLPEARHVYQHQGHSADIGGLFQPVAGGAGHGGHDGSVRAEQGIEEGRFPNVRPTDQCDAQPFAQDAPTIGGRQQRLDLAPHGSQTP